MGGFFFILLILIAYSYDIFNKAEHIADKPLLLIGILSAPYNFQERLSIRKTWLKLASNNSIKHYFLIGNETCDIPPIDRINPYSCIENVIDIPEGAVPETEFSTLNCNDSVGKSELCLENIGFTFYVIHEIVITKLGVVKSLLRNVNSEVRLKLISSFDKKVLASVTISPVLINETNSNLIAKAIKPIKLPKQYEAILLLDGITRSKKFHCKQESCSWVKNVGAVNFIQLIREPNTKAWPYTESSSSLVFMNYKIPGITALKQQANTKAERTRIWKQFNQNILVQLKHEKNVYGDLMFLNVMDVYNNLTEKLIRFFKRITEMMHFHYLLKTDDDSFIDLLRVYHNLSKLKHNESNRMWWWSFYKEFWKVQDSGKWRDEIYRSASYPPFPCGGGYVLSDGIVQYLTENSEYLQRFGGEDVSMGIWLSAISATQHDGRLDYSFSKRNSVQQKIRNSYRLKNKYKFVMLKQCQSLNFASDECSWSCNDERQYHQTPLCNKVQLSVTDMYDAWNEYTETGHL